MTNKKNNNNRGGQTPGARKGARSDSSMYKFTKVTPMVNMAKTNIITRRLGPITRTSANGAIFSNQEKIYTLSGTSASGIVTAGTIGLNPANAQFYWASRVVANYALYRYRRLRVCYSSACPTSTPGEFVMGGFYDINDALAWAAVGNPQGNLSYNEGSTVGPYWGSTMSRDPKGCLTSNIMFEADVERLHARTPWFRVAPGVTSADATPYNQAVAITLALATLYAGAANQYVGDIWVDYEIECIHPQFPQLTTALMGNSVPIGTSDDHPLLDSTVGKFVSARNVLDTTSSEGIQATIPRSPRSLNLKALDLSESQ